MSYEFVILLKSQVFILLCVRLCMKEKCDLIKSLSWLFDLSHFLRLISIAVVKSRPTYCMFYCFP